jgi:hypothetical protein
MPASDRKLCVFLCHSSQDKSIVRELYQRLNAEGWIDPWLDEEKLLPGQDWDMEIEKAVEDSDAIVVCISNTSVSKEGYVQKEIKVALNFALYKPEETIFIIPLRLDDCPTPRNLRSIQYIDFFPAKRQERAYHRLCQSLQLRLEQIIKRETEEQVSNEEEKARKRAEQKARRETSKKTRQEAELREAKEQEERIRNQAEERARVEIELRESREREKLAREEAEEKTRLIADLREKLKQEEFSNKQLEKKSLLEIELRERLAKEELVRNHAEGKVYQEIEGREKSETKEEVRREKEEKAFKATNEKSHKEGTKFTRNQVEKTPLENSDKFSTAKPTKKKWLQYLGNVVTTALEIIGLFFIGFVWIGPIAFSAWAVKLLSIEYAPESITCILVSGLVIAGLKTYQSLLFLELKVLEENIIIVQIFSSITFYVIGLGLVWGDEKMRIFAWIIFCLMIIFQTIWLYRELGTSKSWGWLIVAPAIFTILFGVAKWIGADFKDPFKAVIFSEIYFSFSLFGYFLFSEI